MSQSYYRVFGSPLTLLLDDRLAENYNSFTTALFEAQQRVIEETGESWNPTTQSLDIDTEQECIDAFNTFGEFMNSYIKMNGGSLKLSEEDVFSDYLVKIEGNQKETN